MTELIARATKGTSHDTMELCLGICVAFIRVLKESQMNHGPQVVATLTDGSHGLRQGFRVYLVEWVEP